MCFDYHDQYDSSTRLAKGLTRDEVKRYRDELHAHFGDWQVRLTHANMLAFLAATIGLEQMLDGILKIAGEIIGDPEDLAYNVLVSKNKDYYDLDLLSPYLYVLDYCAAWGWLTYTMEEKDSVSGNERTYVVVEHEPVCQEIAGIIRKRMEARSADTSSLDQYDALAETFADEPK